MCRNEPRRLESKSPDVISDQPQDYIVPITREVENENVSTEIVDGLPHHYEVVDVTVPNKDIVLTQCPAYLTAPTPHAHSEEEKVDGVYETVSSL